MATTSAFASIPRGISVIHPMTIARAQGATVWDTDGREYLDFAAGISVMNVGHGHPKVVAALKAQLDDLTHMCFAVAPYQSYIDVTRQLCELMGTEPHKAALFTTGVEAVENAIKIARAHSKRSAVIAFTGSFHGRSLLGMSLTSSSLVYRQGFGPFAPEIYHAPFPYEYRGWTTERAFEALNQLLSSRVAPSDVAAIIIEPQQGEGGFVPAPVEFLQALRQLCDAHGIVLILDEIQTGFGRTGKMFAFEHAGIAPDIITLAKSLGAGVPISAVVGKAHIMDGPEPGGLGGTYAGNPLACAAALAVLDVMRDEHLVERGRAIGDQLRTALLDLQTRHEAIGDVRGLGCMLAIELVTDRVSKTPNADLAAHVLDAARDKGLLLLKCGASKNVIRFLPPLVTTTTEMTRAVAILYDVLAAIGGEHRSKT